MFSFCPSCIFLNKESHTNSSLCGLTHCSLIEQGQHFQRLSSWFSSQHRAIYRNCFPSLLAPSYLAKNEKTQLLIRKLKFWISKISIYNPIHKIMSTGLLCDHVLSKEKKASMEDLELHVACRQSLLPVFHFACGHLIQTICWWSPFEVTLVGLGGDGFELMEASCNSARHKKSELSRTWKRGRLTD